MREQWRKINERMSTLEMTATLLLWNGILWGLALTLWLIRKWYEG